MEWGAWSGSYFNAVKTETGNQGGTFIDAGSNAGYVKGTDATKAYNFITTNYTFSGGSGTETGTWSKLVGFSKDGIEAPSELKTAMLGQEGNDALAGVFESGGYTILFYITKN